MTFAARAMKVPPNTANRQEAKERVFDFFKMACRSIPTIMDIYILDDVITVSQLRTTIASKIRKYSHVTDPKVAGEPGFTLGLQRWGAVHHHFQILAKRTKTYSLRITTMNTSLPCPCSPLVECAVAVGKELRLSKAARRYYNENFRKSTERRLSKVLAAAGVASRRASEELIFEGKVTVNGSVCNTPQINGSLARRAIKDLMAKGLIRMIFAHASQQIYTRATNT